MQVEKSAFCKIHTFAGLEQIWYVTHIVVSGRIAAEALPQVAASCYRRAEPVRHALVEAENLVLTAVLSETSSWRA